MTDNTSLKPCPFCGNGDAPFLITEDRTWVECGDCTTRVVVGPFDTEAEAIAAWNQRSKPAVPDVREAEEWLGGDWFEKWQDATENADDGLMATLDALRGRVERTILAALTKPAVPDVREALEPAISILQDYIHFLHRIPADDLDLHPYIPAVEDALDRLSAALAALTPQSPRACCEAERERCAKIAERMYEGHGFTLATDRARNFEHAARSIATAIRGADQ